MPITKTVLIIMPFGGEDEEKKRRFILKFKRLQYLTENLRVDLVRRNLPNIPVQFSASVFLTNVGEIASSNFQAIRDADILFCLISESNATVTYELAIRNLLRDELVIFVDGRPEELLPFYLKGMAYIVPSTMVNNRVNDVIEEIVKDKTIDLSFDSTNPFPIKLTEEINRYDNELRIEIYKSLNKVLNQKPRRQPYIIDIMREFDPEYLLSNGKTTTYLPASVVRIKWNAKSRPFGSYLKEEKDGDPVVCDYNEHFLKLYDYNIPPKGPHSEDSQEFTLDDLLEQLKESDIVETDDFDKFISDQNELTEKIVYGNSFSNAEVPLRLNGRHSVPEYRNKAYLPILVTKRIVGQVDRPHTMYLLVVYMDVTRVPQECVPLISAAPPMTTVLPAPPKATVLPEPAKVDQPVGQGGGI
jgi:hypothetical protein